MCVEILLLSIKKLLDPSQTRITEGGNVVIYSFMTTKLNDFNKLNRNVLRVKQGCGSWFTCRLKGI